MSESRKKLEKMKRVQRVRAVENYNARRALAQVQNTQSRLAEMQRKTRNMVQDYAPDCAAEPQEDAQDFCRRAQFSAQLSQIARQCAEQENQGQSQLEQVRNNLLTAQMRADKAQDIVKKHQTILRREADQRR